MRGSWSGCWRKRAAWAARRSCSRSIRIPCDCCGPTNAPPPLTWTDRKAELLAELGVDTTIAYPTDEALLRLTPDEFFQRIVRDTLQAQAMVEGQNFFFGHDRAGNVEVLGQLCEAAGISLEVVEPVIVDDQPVSSSRVRRSIAAGNIDEANRMLTRPYCIRGMVRHGAARGAKIGFPNRQHRCHRHAPARRRCLRWAKRSRWHNMACGDQHRPQSNFWRTCAEGRSASSRLSRFALRPAIRG